MAIRRSTEDKAVDAVVWALLGIILLVTLYPFYYCLVLSFNEGVDATRGGIYLWPRRFTLENYIVILSNAQLKQAFLVTVGRTVIGTLLTLTATGLFAYSMAQRQLLYRKLYMGILVFAMYFSGGLIPVFLIYRMLGLLNTFWVYVIPGMIVPFYVILMIAFYREIPESLVESASLDGANDIAIFFRIVFPISLPIFATIALYSAVGHWNAWFDSAIFVTDKNLKTVSFWLMDLLNKVNKSDTGAPTLGDARAALYANFSYTAQTLRVAMMITVILPIICVYPFLQKYFVKGMMIGSVKG